MSEYATTFSEWERGGKLPPKDKLDALAWESFLKSSLAPSIAGNLIRLRDDVRKGLGKRWEYAFSNARELIRMAMEKNQCNELAAGMKMAEFIGRKFQGEEAKQGKQMFLAAAVEMIDPTL